MSCMMSHKQNCLLIKGGHIMKLKEIRSAKLSELEIAKTKISYPELTRSQIAEAFKRACEDVTLLEGFGRDSKDPRVARRVKENEERALKEVEEKFNDELWYESANARYPEMSIEQIRKIAEDVERKHNPAWSSEEGTAIGKMEVIFLTTWASITYPNIPEEEIKCILYSTKGVVIRGEKVFCEIWFKNRNDLKEAFVENLNKRIKYLERSNVLGERIRKEILEKDYEPLAVFGGVELFMRLKGLNPNDFGIQKETTEIRQKIADWYDIENLNTKVRNEFVNDKLIERNYPTQKGQKIFDEIGIEIIRNPEKFKKIISQVAEIESKINEIL